MLLALWVLTGLVVAASTVALCLTRVRRLHRLHIRVDAARAGLDAALGRRVSAAATAGVPAEAIAPAPSRPHPRPDPGAATTLPVPSLPVPSLSVPSRSVPSLSLSRSVVDAEAVANALSRALGRLDRATLTAEVRAELADAEQLLVVARRVHNDAVRDTLGLRSSRLVRWLRLAGTAPMPAYFEIADPQPGLTYDRVSPSPD